MRRPDSALAVTDLLGPHGRDMQRAAPLTERQSSFMDDPGQLKGVESFKTMGTPDDYRDRMGLKEATNLLEVS